MERRPRKYPIPFLLLYKREVKAFIKLAKAALKKKQLVKIIQHGNKTESIVRIEMNFGAIGKSHV